jgi:hypothetical protein
MIPQTLITAAENLPLCLRRKMRTALYMEKLTGTFKGVNWHSLNPTSAQIRAKDVERTCRQAKKPLHQAYPDSEYLTMLLNKPVLRSDFYRRSRLKIR